MYNYGVFVRLILDVPPLVFESLDSDNYYEVSEYTFDNPEKLSDDGQFKLT